MRKLLILLGIFFCGCVHADLNITVSGGEVAPQPIAIVPFKQGAGVTYDVARVIQDDLDRSGLFRTLKRSDMLEQPSDPSEVNYRNWRVLDMNDLVIGRETLVGNKVSVRFYLLDVYRAQQLLAYEMPPTAVDKLRYVGHRIADLIYKELTGVRGYFDTQIAYVEASGLGDSRTFKLIVSDSDGKFPRVVASSSQPLMSPAWSPDRKKLAFSAFQHGRWCIFIETLATGKLRKLVNQPGLDGAPSWSPDGKKLAVTLSSHGNPDIYIIDVASGERRQLTHDPAIDTEATWSPDGKTIAFTSDRGGSPQIYEMPADGSAEAQRVTFSGEKNMRPRFSPDGKSLALVQYDDGVYRIGLMDLSSGTVKLLTSGPVDTGPSFAPDGAVIIYEQDRGGAAGGTELGVVSTDGVVHQTINTAMDDLQDPAWSPYIQ